MKKKNSYILLLLYCIAFAVQSQPDDFVRYVNPFIGTAEGMPGKKSMDNAYTNPGAVLPWGLISISPFNIHDTTNVDAKRPSPYIYGKKYISGFTHVNMSGTGCNELGVFCLMPATGDVSPQRACYSEYSDEKASPGYYSVRLDNYRIKAEVTATLRTSIMVKETHPR